jgi:hypothetical protein
VPIIAMVAIALAALLSSALLFLHFYGMIPTVTDMLPWQLYVAIILLWVPFFVIQALAFARRSVAFALLFVLAAAQTLHFIEHVAQVTQIHLLGLMGAKAHGLIGMLDLEWVHFAFDALLIPLFTVILLCSFRRNLWLWVLLPLALWHAAEHVVIVHYYVQTGIEGSPGLLSQGGLINGGLPLIRPDLHFLYNLAEETLILLAFFHQSRRLDHVAPTSTRLRASASTTQSHPGPTA